MEARWPDGPRNEVTVKVEILHIADCPSWQAAGEELRAALDATGHGSADINFVRIESPDQAAQLPFAGSPTIVIDGTDLFSSGDRSIDMACRIYATPSGLKGRPDRSQIEEALRRV